jgi:hypothetical protein
VIPKAASGLIALPLRIKASLNGENFQSADNAPAIAGMTLFDWVRYDSILQREPRFS